MTDIEVTEAERRAAVELTRRLRPIVTIQDPAAFAERFIADLRAEGWRPPLGPVPSWKQQASQHGTEPNDAWRQAREALARPEGGGGDDAR